MGNLIDVARRSASGLATEAVTTPLGLPGAGISAAIASALTKGKAPVMELADKLITSPEFEQAIKTAANGAPQKAARTLSQTKAFGLFASQLKGKHAITNTEAWIMKALLANQTSGEIK
jgi:hypothetical protein